MKRACVILIAGIVLIAAGSILYSSAASSVDFTDPMAYVVCAGILLSVIGISMLLDSRKKKTDARSKLRRLAMAGLFAALSYIGFQFFRIDIPVGAEGRTAVHLGNAFVVLGGLFLGGSSGGLSGAIGLTLADLTAGYVTSMPKTFLIKFVIGTLAGVLAERVFRLPAQKTRKARVRCSALASGIALVSNIVLDPLLGYLYKRFLFGIPQDAAAILARVDALATSINTAISFIIVMLVYNAVRPALEKSHLM